MEKLTKRQSEILNFIRNHTRLHQRPPSHREIGRAFGFSSPNGVRNHLTALEKKGFLKRGGEGMARRSRPVSAYRNIPIIGSVAAGSPLLAVENSIGHLSIGDDFETSDIVFAYVVEGDDMDGAGIMDGDHIVIQSPETAETGDAVLVKAAGRFFLRGYIV